MGSFGGLIGAAAGGIAGFMIGGPMGAAIGAGIGGALWMMFNPVQPDAPSPGAPGEVTINTAKEGTVIDEVLGTVKVNGNIMWSCCQRSVEVKEEMQGGKGGGSQEVTKGWEYYLTWAIGICLGPVDNLFTIYANDKVVWSGELERPVSGGYVTIYLDGMGYCDFYFGTEDQVQNVYWAAKVDATLLPAYRGQCYAVMKDCKLGSYPRAPSMFFVLQKTPEIAALSDAPGIIETYDYNPAHAIYYLADAHSQIDGQYLDTVDFNSIALTLAGEARGISLDMANAQEALGWIEAILTHINGGLRWGIDGKLHPVLFRAAVDVASLPQITQRELTGLPELERGSWLETINDYKVQYSKRIFREATCPSGCDNFQGDTATEIGPGDERIFTIQNDGWTDESCGDEILAYLSDGLPEEKRGTFSELTYLGGGRWRFKYTASEALCDDQEDPAESCPIICGHRIPCCTCATAPDLEFDDASTPDTIAEDSSIEVYVTGGFPPFTWEASDGFGGHYFDQPETIARHNTLICPSGTIGVDFGAVVTITVTDWCGQQCEATIRNTSGFWRNLGLEYRKSAAYCASGCGVGSPCREIIGASVLGVTRWLLRPLRPNDANVTCIAPNYMGLDYWEGNSSVPNPPCGTPSQCADFALCPQPEFGAGCAVSTINFYGRVTISTWDYQGDPLAGC